jgi:hypothetical protein
LVERGRKVVAMNGKAAEQMPEMLRAISALAVVKVNWDENKDYIANFIPVVAHCIGRGEHDEVSRPDTQAIVDAEFGLRIPHGAMQTILNRMAREGLLTRRHGIFVRKADALADFDLGSEREDVLRQHRNLVGRLVEFAAELGREWNEEQAERALLGYVEILAEPILAAVVDGEPIVELPKIDGEGSVLTNRFVLDLCRSDPQAFEYLVTIVKGTMLANVLFLPETFAGGRERLIDVEILLDTPVVLRGLGYAEEQYREPIQELLSLLVDEGAKLRIFEHTLHEVEGVLDAAAATYRTGAKRDHFPGDVVDYFASESLSRSDVEMQVGELRDRLDARGIEIRGTPEHTEELNLAEAELEKTLKEAVHYGRREAMVRDLDSLTAIYRIRGGEGRRRIESSGAILVTTNSALAHASQLFFYEVFGRRTVPICMADHSLAALVWLMNPSQAPDLPRRQIIAISFAALNPPDEVWRRYLAEIRRLQERGELTEEQVGLLLFSPDARLELMNATQGDADALASGTIAQVLERAEAAARQEVEVELVRERGRRADAEREAVSERGRAAAEARRAERVAAKHADRLHHLAGRIAGGLAWAALAIVAAVLILASAAGAQGIFPSSWAKAIPFASALVFLLALLTLVSLLTGWNLLKSRRWLAARIKTPLSAILHRLFGLRNDDQEAPG